MKMFKGFDKDLKCQDFQYEIGKDYEEKNASLCNYGFHACENPLHVFGYYPPSQSRYCEVDLDDLTDETSDDSKRCGKKIKLNAEIGIKGIINASLKFAFDKIDFDNAEQSSSGDWSTAASSGYWSTAASSGYSSTAASSGDWSTAASSGDSSTAASSGYSSTAASSGDWSTAASSGDWSTAEANGKESVAIAPGYESKAKGALGCFLVLGMWSKDDNDDWHMIDVKVAKVDGETIKADTFYMLKDGEFVEVEEK